MTGHVKKVIVGMSGGVDSSVATALLIKAGYQVTGMTMKLWNDKDPAFPGEPTAISSAKAVSDLLGVEHQIWDLSDLFAETVIKYFVTEYTAGRTPNPCVWCNRFIKWGEVIKRAKALGADCVATGHYVRSELNTSTDRYELRKANDPKKDQSYVLWGLSQEALSMAIFPLSYYTKDHVRQLAKELKLPSAQNKESQEICFIPHDDYNLFLKVKRPELSDQRGSIVTSDGKIIGQHDGYPFYTIGQRRGVGVAMNHPVYVTSIDAKTKTITVGPVTELYARGLKAGSVNFIPFGRLPAPMKVTAKIRYNDPGHPAIITQTGETTAEVIFDEPQRAITPGQSAVFYDDDLLIGGGIIETAIK